GYFALTSRYGDSDDFKTFVDEAHRLGLGVILDWVPGHFPTDGHGLARFDGRPLFEPADPQRAIHPDWETAVFDFGRPEVVSFLISSARFWLEEYHLDGLRVDAVSSMLYLDYSREEGEWEPNELGGPENLEAAAFVRALNAVIREHCPGALMFAEESRTWPGVTDPLEEDGLGFDFKWNMGWMNDTLRVIETAPFRRSEEHERLTFSLHYAHDERHVLPLSHDEVVHLKRSLLSKMPGGYDDKFAGLRLLLGYMWTHPGAKLLFMGGEIGQWAEWSEARELDWDLLRHPAHARIQDWVRALNTAYRDLPALHALDHTPEGFEWVDVHDAERSVLSYLRWDHDWQDCVCVVANFAATPWKGYVLGVPSAGEYEIVLDSAAPEYGSRRALALRGAAAAKPHVGRPARLVLDLPRLGFAVLRPTVTPARANV
ncbi:MAG: 1,4-alpha-glucan branching enzyme, partial [Gemmatimonadetes bacterium]|nr:1,4-alpha-glucan branching enzyme [Gemmatimonadota bacterium]